MVCALVAATAGASTATQSLTGVPLPGLTSDEGSNVDAESCSVTLSGRDVTVALSVRVDSDQAALLIEGSRFGWRGESAAYPDRHFPELEIQIDGALVKPEDRFEAFMGKTDITGAIRDAGMDPWAVAHDPPATPVRPDSRALKVLERMHAVQRSGDEYLANWTARRVLRIPLKDSKHQRIELHYRARPAATQVQSDQLFTSEREAAYCLSAKANASRGVRNCRRHRWPNAADGAAGDVRANRHPGGRIARAHVCVRAARPADRGEGKSDTPTGAGRSGGKPAHTRGHRPVDAGLKLQRDAGGKPRIAHGRSPHRRISRIHR